MSRPNTANDPQAPLLVGERPENETEDDPEQSGNRKITIFNKTFSLFHLIVGIVGTLALVAIGVSIAAIGIFMPVFCFSYDKCFLSNAAETRLVNRAIVNLTKRRMCALHPNAYNSALTFYALSVMLTLARIFTNVYQPCQHN